MELPVYKLSIDFNNPDGAEVSAIALVDMPAIERDFFAFNKVKQYFINEEQRIISGPLMIPDKPIYRENEEFGSHYVMFDAPTIKAIAIKYAKKKYSDQVNEMHSKFVDGVTLFETFISDAARGVQPMKGYEDLPNGTWFGSMYVENDSVWQQVKDGTFRGFSVEGEFKYEPPVMSAEMRLKQLRSILGV